MLPDPTAYSALFDFSYRFTHRLPVAGLNPFDLLASLRAEVGRYHFFEYGLEFALVGASLVYMAVRRTSADRRLLVFLGVTFLCFVFFVGNKHDVYAILLYPFMMLAVADTLVSLIRDGEVRETAVLRGRALGSLRAERRSASWSAGLRES